MDRLDRRLLRQLQRDSSISAGKLAQICGTTESTALRRIRRMRREGIIRSEVVLVDPNKVGRGLQMFVRVRLERESGDQVRSFIERVEKHPDVMQFFFVTGTTDYMILLCVRTMEDYDRFLQENIVPDPAVVLSSTNVVIRPIKWSHEVTIDDT